MISAAAPIPTLASLRDHLQYAIGLELTTIPAYLCSLFTLDQDSNSAAYETIQTVVMEEMLHMTLAANVLNAIGGVPSPGRVGDGPSPVPVYPTKVPYIDRIPLVRLLPFSVEAVDEFLAIEQPDAGLPPSGDGEQYDSIGAFYDAVEAGLRSLATPEVFAEGAATRGQCQIGSRLYYGGAGTLFEVRDLDTALAALQQIVRQGEGVPAVELTRSVASHALRGLATPGRGESLPYDVDDGDVLPYGWKMYSHYARFKEIREGANYLPDQLVEETPRGDVLPVDWSAVAPMTPDPTAAMFSGTPAYAPMVAFNEAYTSLVNLLYRTFDGEPEALTDAVHLMWELKYRAGGLLSTPSPLNPSLVLGPAFEYLGAAPVAVAGVGATRSTRP